MSAPTLITADLVVGARAGQWEAREKLGERLLRMAEAAASRTGARGADLEDLRQVGTLAAYSALLGPSWNPEKGQPSSYAYRTAARAIGQESARMKSPVRLNRADSTAHRAIRRARRQLETQGRSTPAEIAALANQHMHDVLAVLDPVMSADGPAAQEALALDPEPWVAATEAEAESHRRDELRRMANDLTPRQRTVLDLRCGLNGPQHTLREIGEILDIPKSRVWRTIRSATNRLRARGPPECMQVGRESTTADGENEPARVTPAHTRREHDRHH